MKKLLGMSLIAFIASTGAFAQITPKMYAGLGIGKVSNMELKNDFTRSFDDTTFAFSGFAGLDLTEYFSVQADLSHYTAGHAESGVFSPTSAWRRFQDMTFTNLMANAMFKIPGKFRPYIGLGLGLASYTSDFTYEVYNPSTLAVSLSDIDNTTGTEFAYQYAVGFEFNVSESVMLGLEYRTMYTTMEDADFETSAIQGQIKFAF